MGDEENKDLSSNQFFGCPNKDVIISTSNKSTECYNINNSDDLSNIKEKMKEIQISDSFLENKILVIVNGFKEKSVSFKEFLNLNIKNFLSLKRSGIYDTLIEHYRSEKGKNKLIFIKAYHFANPFKTWIYELKTSITEVIDIVEKNFEILQYVVYNLIEGSENENANVKISGLSKYISSGQKKVRNTAKLLGKLSIIDYKRSYGIESDELRNVTSTRTGALYHVSFHFFLTNYFGSEFHKKVYSEPYILKPMSSDHPDSLILLNHMNKDFQDHFRNEFNIKNSALIDFFDYEYVIVDFTTFISTVNIKNKLEKYFPPPNVLFLIVGIGLKSDMEHNYKNLILPYNVKIISPEFFCRLIQLDLPKNKNYFSLFSKILKNVKEQNIEVLKRINDMIETDLYNTEDLMNDLGTENLSEIFKFTDTSSEFIKLYMEKLENEIENYGASLNLPPECIETAKNLILKANELGIIRINYDPIGYAGASLYLSSRFLLQKNTITQEMIYDNLKITDTPLKSRTAELTQNDEILFNILFDASVDQILSKLDITSIKIKKLAIKLIKLAFEKIYNIQEKESAHKEPIVITATAVYLAANFLGETVSQETMATIIGFTKSAIYYTLGEFKAIEDEFKKMNIELVDPIGKKRLETSMELDEQIIGVLNKYGELNTKQILAILNEDSSKMRNIFDHLNKMAEQGILRKKLIQVGRSLQVRWKIKDFDDRIVEILEKEERLNTTQIRLKLKLDLSRESSLEKSLNKLVENGLIKNVNDSWRLIKSKTIDDEIIDLLKEKGELNTLQIISELKQFSQNTLRPHLNDLAKLGTIKKDQRREGRTTINYWELSND